DEYAGGTVVLPQAGEHTKSEDEKAGATGTDTETSEDSQQSDDSGDQHTEEIPAQRESDGAEPHQKEGGLRRLFHRS
ncbi:MAG TPA: hypothetical protein VGH76_26480, partial [Actinomycetospora sp.]|uniref:hypothetical protein n=1 Tax=Actinomycetospora sp. TaxID=1872135 RepID=UPI002F408980